MHDYLIFEGGNQKYRGRIEGAKIVERKANPSCGDVAEFYINFESGLVFENIVIDSVKFEGQGCVLSMACASLAAKNIRGLTTGSILALKREDVFKWLSVESGGVPFEVGPMRFGCVMLGVEAVQRGILLWKKSLKLKI